jgi:hypothetical protein
MKRFCKERTITIDSVLPEECLERVDYPLPIVSVVVSKYVLGFDHGRIGDGQLGS